MSLVGHQGGIPSRGAPSHSPRPPAAALLVEVEELFRVLTDWVSGASFNFGLQLSGNKMKVWGMLCLHSDVSFPFTSTAEYPGRCFHSNLEDFINLQTFRYWSKLLHFGSLHTCSMGRIWKLLRREGRWCKSHLGRYAHSQTACLSAHAKIGSAQPRGPLKALRTISSDWLCAE